LLARIRPRLRAGVPGAARAYSLTDRELEVLTLLVAGLDQEAIATDMGIRPKTVGTHIEQVLIKLGVQSRAQAVALAYREHLLDGQAHAR
jgi:DNA-binding NarL/FixJ family response regulator